jgi:hypothetical protein
MGDRPLSEPDPGTLDYATPVQRLRRIRPVPAMIGGVFLVLIAALTLLIGFAMISKLSLSGDLEVVGAFAVCIFSALCLIAGIPLIYRGSRTPE